MGESGRWGTVLEHMAGFAVGMLWGWAQNPRLFDRNAIDCRSTRGVLSFCLGSRPESASICDCLLLRHPHDGDCRRQCTNAVWVTLALLFILFLILCIFLYPGS